MNGLRRRGLAGVMVLGVIALGATVVSGDQRAGLRISCTAAPGLDAARASDICADFLEAARNSSGFATAALEDAPLTAGPGLEIVITRATDNRLEVLPTFVDGAGQRVAQPSAGVVTMDTRLTQTRRLAFFQKLLADLSR